MQDVEELLDELCRSGAIAFSFDSYFEWSSGIKAPVYIDHRYLIGDVNIRGRVIQALINLVISQSPEKPEVIAGVSTGGVPWAAWIASELHLPMAYVRPIAKDHGKKNFVEGASVLGRRVVLVEDVFTTGGSAIRCAEKIIKLGGQIQSIVGIMNYQMYPIVERFFNMGFGASYIYDFSAVMSALRRSGVVSDDIISNLDTWHKARTDL